MTSPNVWKCCDGRELAIHEMTDVHLINSWKMLYAKGSHETAGGLSLWNELGARRISFEILDLYEKQLLLDHC